MSEATIQQQIETARPRLGKVSPLVSKVIFGFGLLNILFGISLMLSPNTSSRQIAIVNDVLTLKVHGALFVALGVFKLYSHACNKWEFMRVSLLMGVLIKSFWLYALIALVLSGSWGTLVFTVIWLFIAYIQICAYIDFLPSPKRKTDE